jgi:hypothetical protein
MYTMVGRTLILKRLGKLLSLTLVLFPAMSRFSINIRTRAGIPQIVIPQWYDTYDYATRVKYLGIGVYGNTVAGHGCNVDLENYKAPLMVDAKEFGDALLKVVGANEGDADTMREKARAIGKICQKSGGRVQAAHILRDLAVAP